MAGDQQFCLRWNNHQSTLTSIFGVLLESENLLDCTLVAEGQCLKAHRILLSACSPYFQSILSQHAERHPIFILKDVTFRELRALMDYMYKGEVNVSQDELGQLLKVAENLKIKGLSDSGEKTADERPAPPPPPPRLAPPPAQQTPTVPRSGGLTIEHRRSNYQSNDLHAEHPSASDESPVPRKRKRTRRRSSEDESGLGQSQPLNESLNNSSVSDPSSLVIQPVRLQPTSTAPSKTTAVIPEPPTTLEPEPPAHPMIVPKTELPIEQVLVPKQEIDDMANEDNDYEDLTLDDDNDIMDDSQPGPSHGSEGSSSQGFPPWQVGTDGSIDEDMLRAQEAAGGTRDAQGAFAWPLPYTVGTRGEHRSQRFECPNCSRSYSFKQALNRHRKHECGTNDRLFQCVICAKCFKRKDHLTTHLKIHSKFQ